MKVVLSKAAAGTAFVAACSVSPIISAFAMSSTPAAKEDAARLKPWEDRWTHQRIGWHETEIHDALLRFGPQNDGYRRICVPLCGKTVDMAYLATTNTTTTIIGIDGVAQALDTFAQEQPQLGLVKQQQVAEGDASSLTVPQVLYRTPKTPPTDTTATSTLELLCGDFFALAPIEPRCDFIFDRASMVAIDPSLRQAYVDVLDQRVLATTSTEQEHPPTILLVALERTSGTDWDREGPPFSLSDIETYYPADRWTVTLLEDKGEITANQDRPMVSKYYQVRRKQQGVKVSTEEL